jgi:hypothetical protein
VPQAFLACRKAARSVAASVSAGLAVASVTAPAAEHQMVVSAALAVSVARALAAREGSEHGSV